MLALSQCLAGSVSPGTASRTAVFLVFKGTGVEFASHIWAHIGHGRVAMSGRTLNAFEKLQQNAKYRPDSDSSHFFCARRGFRGFHMSSLGKGAWQSLYSTSPDTASPRIAKHTSIHRGLGVTAVEMGGTMNPTWPIFNRALTL